MRIDRQRTLRSFACAALVLAACEGGSPPVAPAPTEPPPFVEPAGEPPPPPAEPAPDWLERIDSADAWSTMAAPSSEHAIARTEVIKVLWDHVTDRVYYCQSDRWPIHYDFAVRFIQSDERALGTRREFNQRQYLRADREMQMASVVRYVDGDLYALELGPADNLDGEGLVALYDRVRTTTYFGEALRYRPRSELHRDRARRVRDRVHAIEPNDVWAEVRYQPLTLGRAVGRLRVVDGPLDPTSVRADEIVVLDHVPLDIPLSAGVITGELQAPLAHVAVLTQSRGTPNMALRDATHDEAVRALAGRVVSLSVEADRYSLAAATEAELESSRRSQARATVEPPALDRTPHPLTATCELRIADTAWAGAKAAQLGEICGAGIPTSEGFVVPVHHAMAHLASHAIDASAASLRGASGFVDDASARDRALGALRDRIRAAPVDPRLVHEVRARTRTLSDRRWIFRSSTNAEDLEGFSGAGLYDSIVTDENPDEAAIADAIARVWASVYTRRAWDEREHYGIDHDAVAMAILVQPLVTDVVAMGVAITENPFSRQRSGILVDLAPPGGSVTAAEGDELPEQLLLYRHSRPEVLSRSTRNGGRPILAADAMRPLRERLDAVHAHMMALWGDRADAADVELAIRRDMSAVILQARPYRMRRAAAH
ncbi:MAG: PEP/pyruvate-binding domain-containing protein [Sandaracinaceae bacterium]